MSNLPKAYVLGQNFPNPFNPTTEISLGLPKDSDVRLIVYDMLGRQVATVVDGEMSAGSFFKLSEAVSFVVNCQTQEEIDYYWEKLSVDPKTGQCGWLKDKYGVSWQIVPAVMYEMQKDKDRKKLPRVTEAFPKMKKFDIEEFKRAYEGR